MDLRQLRTFLSIAKMGSFIQVDENIITSSPSTALEVAFVLLERLTSAENCRYVKYLMGFQDE